MLNDEQNVLYEPSSPCGDEGFSRDLDPGLNRILTAKAYAGGIATSSEAAGGGVVPSRISRLPVLRYQAHCRVATPPDGGKGVFDGLASPA